MKKFFSLLFIFTIFMTFLFVSRANAQVSCGAKVDVYYHRWDANETGYEIYTWDNGTGGTNSPVAVTASDFGGMAELTVCSDAKDKIGLIAKVAGTSGTWIKDGIDANKDGQIDDKFIDVTDIRGSSRTKNVYLLQGSNEVLYQDPNKDYYLGKTSYGNLVVVYYNPTGYQGWDDFWTWWGQGNDSFSGGVPFDNNLGVSGGTDPNLFHVAVLNVPATADDQIGFMVRQGKGAWTAKDTAWASSLTADETDENGNTYKTTGDRLIRVTDIKGAGYKFVFVINGVKTIYEDFNKFIAEAFKLDFTTALFRSTKALSITLNQSITYGATGPDVTKFSVKDNTGKTYDIDKITFDSLATSGNTFNIVLKNDIVPNKTYTVTYNYDQFGEQKSTSAQATVADTVFTTTTPATTTKNKTNYTILTVAGIVVVVAAGVGVALALGRKK